MLLAKCALGMSPAHARDPWRNGAKASEKRFLCDSPILQPQYDDYGHRRATAAVPLPSHTHRYARCALFSKRHTCANLTELDLISVVRLAKHRAHMWHVKPLREEEFCELQGRDTFELSVWQASSWKPVLGGCLEALPAAYLPTRRLCCMRNR